MSSQVAITIDVEWAHPEVLDFVVNELDCRNLQATFFCTHAGIELTGHERALHPNYRRHGNSLLEGRGQAMAASKDIELYQYIARSTRAFCPEAVGSRSHNLFWDSALASIYRDQGLKYTSNMLLPLVPGLEPLEGVKGLVEFPIYYMDHWDLDEGVTGFRLDSLRLERDGLMVLDFHPNLIFINAQTAAQYAASKPYYHDPGRLKALRAPGRGVLTLFREVLDFLVDTKIHPVLLRDVAASRRKAAAA
jgi:hypothetical protein